MIVNCTLINATGITRALHVLCFLITFISDDDHRNLQIEVTFAPALGRALGRAHFSFQDRFTQSDGLLEGFSTVQTEHHHEQVSCVRNVFDEHKNLHVSRRNLKRIVDDSR